MTMRLRQVPGYLLRLISFCSRSPVISVVRLSGAIGGGSLRKGLSLARVANQLEAAFSGRRTRAVAILVNSPGGSPVQADLIQRRIRDLSDEHKIPVFAFCEDVAASGGYWIALAASEIHANPSSVIGSIGVISAGFGFDKAIDKLGIERRVYASGPMKGMLDPFRAENQQDIDHLRRVQQDIFEDFCDEVRRRRSSRLTAEEPELFNGAFWTGKRALELGLIDGLGDMQSTMRERFGQNIRFHFHDQRRSFLQRLTNATGGRGEAGSVMTLADDLLEELEVRMLWRRFGL